MSPAKKNLTSNIISLIIRTVFVLVLIPFYIKFLGEELYSDWIVLYTLPAIFELTNFGINQAVNNTFSIHFNKKIDESNRIITHGLYFTFLIGLIVSSSVFLIWDNLGIKDFLNILIVKNYDSKLIILFLTIKVFLDMTRGILSSYLFASNLNHFTIYINTLQYTIESILIITLIYLGNSLVNVSAMLIIPTFLSCLLLSIINNLKFNYSFDWNFELKYLKMLIKPSYSFSLLSISEYILNQGFIVIFKKFYLSEALIIFNSAKTLTNYIKQIQGLIATSVFPVFNVYFGKGQSKKLHSLFFKSRNITIGVSIILCLGFLLFGKSIWNLWLDDSVQFDNYLFNIMIFIQLLSSFWIIPSNLIISMNKHFIFSILYLSSSVLSLLGFYIFNSLFLISFSIVPVFYFIHQILMMLYSNYQIKGILKK